MSRVFIPKRLLTPITVEEEIGGHWDNGEWIEGIKKTITFKGVYFPFNSSDIKNFKEGYIEVGDIDLRAKVALTEKSIIELNGVKYEVNPNLDYGYLADIKFYILKKVINNVHDNQETN
ncbi:hypothetical protein [uncultured Clostridium sp.]|uniref:hypothetical protein n=1 Tax=uncultured Clostridium sp. TaxID=59620 RepID=UPI00263623B8|nr:hypothetical protein [uncultured Clostridium sp.]